MSKMISVPSRGRRTVTQWRQVVNAQLASGLSQEAYCRRHHIPYSSFCHWKRHLRDAEPVASSLTTPAFVEVTPTVSVKGAGFEVELELGEGVYLRVRRG